MTSREKILAAFVGLSVLIVGVAFGSNMLMEGLRGRRNQAERLRQEINEKEFTLDAGQRAVSALNDFDLRALPAEKDEARKLYSAWLLDIAVKRVGLAVDSVIPVSTGRSRGGTYTVHTFNLAAEGELPDVAALLFELQSVDIVHRIKLLHLQPIKGSKQLKITLIMEAMSLPNAPAQLELVERPGELLAGKTLADYQPFLDRNFFGPPNQPPSLSGSESYTATIDREFSLTAQASDPDELDSLFYEFDAGDEPEAAGLEAVRFDEKSGKLSWTPRELGEYEFVLRVHDDGLPVKTTERRITIHVQEPPPPEPKVEAERNDELLKFAFITAITDSGGVRQIWLTRRDKDETLKLREGDRFEIDDFVGVVVAIGVTDVEYEAFGKRQLVSLGENLSQSQELKDGEI